MNRSHARVTRGRGFLEPLLARLRMRRAERFIGEEDRSGRILDVGCGAAARFLETVRFQEKHGVDQQSPTFTPQGVSIRVVDLNRTPELPYPDAYFRVVTLLAVVEHLSPSAVNGVLAEVYRVLDTSGRVIITTPAPWSDPLLKGLARLGLVSREEIEEHENVLRRKELANAIVAAGFHPDRVETGYFELGLNMWATALK